MIKLDKCVPCFYWPSSVVLIDDSFSFIKTMSDYLTAFYPHFYTFSDPEKGIAFINQQKSLNLLEELFQSDPDDDRDNVMVTHVNINAIQKKLSDKSRYNVITTVVIDYDMPEGSGLSYIDKIETPVIGKILLTGVANTDEVINAFNAKIIDKYLPKQKEQAPETLEQYIAMVQVGYFSELTKHLLKHNVMLYNTLTNPQFINLFKEVISQHHIKEFYLLDNYGSFLLVDNNKQLKVLALIDGEILAGMSSLFESEEIENHQLYEPYLNKRKMPFFAGDILQMPHYTEWHRYTHDCQQISGTNLYYSLISDLTPYGLKYPL